MIAAEKKKKKTSFGKEENISMKREGDIFINVSTFQIQVLLICENDHFFTYGCCILIGLPQKVLGKFSLWWSIFRIRWRNWVRTVEKVESFNMLSCGNSNFFRQTTHNIIKNISMASLFKFWKPKIPSHIFQVQMSLTK